MFVVGGTIAPPVASVAGAKKWTFATGDAVESSPTLSPNGTTVYVGSDDKSLYAVDAASGTQQWTFATGDEVDSSPTLSPDGSTVYVGSADHSLYAVSTGGLAWASSKAMASFAPAL